MFRRGRTDANQEEIVRELRARGVSVAVMSKAGDGFPDLVAGHRGRTYLLEVKTGPNEKLTPAQIKFQQSWRGQWARVSNAVEAWEVVSE
jgi:Holliday junction resolvase